MPTNSDRLRDIVKNPVVQTTVLLGLVVAADTLYSAITGKKSNSKKFIKNVLKEIIEHYE